MRSFFAVFCALLLMPTLASAELISITELVQETPEAWIEEIDVNGKTISIDAPIYVPEVETLPVIRVMREKTVENTEALFKKEGTKYNEIRDGCFISIGMIRDDIDDTGENRVRVIDRCINDFWDMERNSDIATMYGKDHESSVYEAKIFLQGMLDEMYHRENINVQIQKVEFETDYIVSKKEKQEIIQDALRSKEVTKGMKGIGAYSIRANQMMESIPIIGTAILGIKETIKDECYNELGDGYCNIEFRFEDEQNIEISLASFYSEQETILPNMNVCHFDKIKQSIVDMIRKGKMENVYSMELGYVVYGEEGQAYQEQENTKFVLVPTWLVRGCYARKDKVDYGMQMTDETFDYMKLPGFQVILIDAQTGEVRNLRKPTESECYMPIIKQ